MKKIFKKTYGTNTYFQDITEFQFDFEIVF